MIHWLYDNKNEIKYDFVYNYNGQLITPSQYHKNGKISWELAIAHVHALANWVMHMGDPCGITMLVNGCNGKWACYTGSYHGIFQVFPQHFMYSMVLVQELHLSLSGQGKFSFLCTECPEE